jgi:hypothetical protein
VAGSSSSTPTGSPPPPTPIGSSWSGPARMERWRWGCCTCSSARTSWTEPSSLGRRWAGTSSSVRCCRSTRPSAPRRSPACPSTTWCSAREYGGRGRRSFASGRALALRQRWANTRRYPPPDRSRRLGEEGWGLLEHQHRRGVRSPLSSGRTCCPAHAHVNMNRLGHALNEPRTTGDGAVRGHRTRPRWRPTRTPCCEGWGARTSSPWSTSASRRTRSASPTWCAGADDAGRRTFYRGYGHFTPSGASGDHAARRVAIQLETIRPSRGRSV